MMDAVVAQHEQAPAREVLRDGRGTIIGSIERQRLTSKLVARNKQGKVVGVHDPRAGETRNARGRVISRGNLLPALLLSAP